MEFEYHLTKFDMPEYETGNCETIDIYLDPEEAYKAMNQLEAANKWRHIFYDVVLRQKLKR